MLRKGIRLEQTQNLIVGALKNVEKSMCLKDPIKETLANQEIVNENVKNRH